MVTVLGANIIRFPLNKHSFQGFSWHMFGTIQNLPMEADGYGFGSGYRQHHWGKGGKGFGNHGYPNMVWPIAWEGHAGKRLRYT